MRVSTIIGVLLKAIIIPVIAVLGLDKFNLFEYISFVPADYRYEIGLAVYLTLIEAVYGFIENIVNQRRANVICTFYISEGDEDIKNTPSIRCDDTIGVATINCHLQLSGNLKLLRKCKLYLELPSWLTSQVNVLDTVLSYTGNQLNWEFDRMLPTTGIKNQVAEYKNKISLIKNASGNNLTIELEPQMVRSRGVKFETNGFKVQNGG
ncbi:MAG: hypothetical protein E7211_20650 [Clostridium lundense]|nr:hypothetical protein [Clostridium lundense]